MKSGPYDDGPAVFATWARAAMGWHESQNLKLARFGDNMRDVAVTEADKVEAQRVFGMSVNTWGVNDLVARVDGASDAEVDAVVQDYTDSYEVVPELLPMSEDGSPGGAPEERPLVACHLYTRAPAARSAS